MQKWEYCLVNFTSIYHNGHKEDYVKGASKFTAAYIPLENISAQLEKLGKEGWEVVGVGETTWTLKRPLL